MATLRTGDGLTDVVVTAVVSSTALAAEAEDSWRRLLEGESGVRFLDKEFVEQFKSPVRIGAELRENFDEHLNRVERRRLSYMQKMAVGLSRRLWESAGSPDVGTTGLMVSIGLAQGSTEALVLLYDDFLERGMRAANLSRCRCTCPTRPPPLSDWTAALRPASSALCWPTRPE